MLTRTLLLYRNSFSGLSKDVWLLSLVTLINRSGSMVLPFLTIYLTQQLGFTLGEAGIVMSAFGAGSIVGTYIGGQLTDRIGYYPVMFWTLLLGGASFFVLMQMESLLAFSITIFGLTMVLDAFRPAAFASISAYSRPENRTRSLSLLRLSINLGVAIGPAAGGLLAASVGYKWLFLIDGATCMLAAILFWLLLENKKEEQPTTSSDGAPIDFSASVYSDKVYLVFLACMLLTCIAFMQILSTLPVFFNAEMGLNEGQIGLLMAMNGLIIVIIEMPIIFVLEQRFPKLILIGAGAFLIALAFGVFLVFPGWAGVAVLSIVFLTLGEIVNFPFSSAYAADRSSPHNRGRYMGLYTMTFSIAHVISPGLGMFTAQALGYATLWGGMSVLALLGFVGFVILEYRTGVKRTN